MFNINDILIQSYPSVTWSYVRSLTINGIINKLSSIHAITNNFFPHKYFLFGKETETNRGKYMIEITHLMVKYDSVSGPQKIQ